MNHRIREAASGDRDAVMRIFNTFVRDSFAAYADEEVPEVLFDSLVKDSRVFLVVESEEEGVIGFGFIRPYREYRTFSHTGVLTYFLLPGHTRKGLGTLLLERLAGSAERMGIWNLVAHISSRNEQSLRFHEKHGFKVCGRLEGIGRKFGEYFDVVWVQKMLKRQEDTGQVRKDRS